MAIVSAEEQVLRDMLTLVLHPPPCFRCVRANYERHTTIPNTTTMFSTD